MQIKTVQISIRDLVRNFIEPDWLLPHLNSKRIHAHKTIYIGKD